MNLLEHNRRAWNRQAAEHGVWSTPVDADAVARARAGDWRVILTPKRSVPPAWFGDVRGKHVLCLASGGGQQVPILAAAGARVVSFDLSDAQLAADRDVASREGLEITCERGDMADLSRFADGTFDLVFHPASNVFVPDVMPVWRECHRVLRAGGVLLAGFMNPLIFMFDHADGDARGELRVKYALPYSDLGSLDAVELARRRDAQEPLEFSHTLETQIGGQLAVGFHLTALFEDTWLDDSWPIARYTPVALATRAVKPVSR